jgi:hypothetical protein
MVKLLFLKIKNKMKISYRRKFIFKMNSISKISVIFQKINNNINIKIRMNFKIIKK